MKNKLKHIIAAALTLLLCGCSDGRSNIETVAPQNGIPFTSATLPRVSETVPITTSSDTETSISDTETTAQTETAAEEPEKKNRAVIAFAGDCTQSDVFGESTSWRGTDYPLEDVASLFKTADLSFINLETSVSSRGKSEKKAGYGFRTDPKFLEVFTKAGIDIVSCANNHTRDYGMDALSDTFYHLSSNNICYVGAGEYLEEAKKLAVFDLNGVSVGFTACNMINANPTWYATDERAGIMCVDYADSEKYLELISDYNKQCDVLFVSIHWGIEYQNTPTDEQIDFAHKLCDNGADVILGHHPHVLQPIEAYNGSFIFYSLGNFLFYKSTDSTAKTALFKLEVDKNGFIYGSLFPVYINGCKSNLLAEDSEMYKDIIETVRKLSEPKGVTITDNGDIKIKQ